MAQFVDIFKRYLEPTTNYLTRANWIERHGSSSRFVFPIASFDIDESNFQIVYKLAGQLYSCEQDHTPFDVVAWPENYVSYKYELESLVNSATVDKDQSDPSIYCVLEAKSKTPVSTLRISSSSLQSGSQPSTPFDRHTTTEMYIQN